ncbi:rRNA-processing protein EBP2, partial [Tremellales sp. Uapishka_1]
MVALSKKESRKQLVKGKGKEETSKAVAVKAPVESDSEEELEDDDEDNGGVSEAGLKRLMELVGPDDLNEFERAQLEEDEDEDEDDDEDFEDVTDEDEDEDEGEDEEDSAMSGEESDGESDDEVEAADPDDLPLDDLASDLSVDEDAVPVRKVTANNRGAMKILSEGLRVTNMPWAETLVLSSKDVLEVDAQDDLQREMAFYKLALEAIPQARKLATKFDIPFTRPTDYYAEMVKSDEHMERIRTKLVEEAGGIKKSEAAKKQRELKKFGKQIQHEKLKAREQDKKGLDERLRGIKRKRKDGMDIGEEKDDGEFDIALDDAIEGKGAERGDRGGRGKSKVGPYSNSRGMTCETKS